MEKDEYEGFEDKAEETAKSAEEDKDSEQPEYFHFDDWALI